MLDRAKLVNVQLFLERAPVTGVEAYSWAETHQAVLSEIKQIDALKKVSLGSVPFPGSANLGEDV